MLFWKKENRISKSLPEDPDNAKFQITSPKCQTNANEQNSKSKTENCMMLFATRSEAPASERTCFQSSALIS